MTKHEYLQRLSARQPEAFKKFDFSRIPDVFRTTDKIVVICPIHGPRSIGAINFLTRGMCIECHRDIYRRSNDEFITELKEKYGNLPLDFSPVKYKSNVEHVFIRCIKHDVLLKKVPKVLLKGVDDVCHLCRDERLVQMFADRQRENAPEGIVYGNVTSKDGKPFIEKTCGIHGTVLVPLKYGMSTSGCQQCVYDALRVDINHFIEKAKQRHGDKYDYSSTVYVSTSDPVTIRCPRHGPFTQRASSHTDGVGCPRCHLEDKIPPKEYFIEEARKVHGNKYDYSKVVYKGNKKPVQIGCPRHGFFWVRPNSHTSSKQGCGRCRESYGEVVINKLLSEWNITFHREYKIEGFRYRFDFYLPDFNIFIERHGIQHYKPVERFGGEKGYQRLVERDQTKVELIKSLKGKLIVVPYTVSGFPAISEYLVKQLKKIIRYWFNENGKVVTFRKASDVYTYFSVPSDVLVRDLEKWVFENIRNVKEVFSRG